MKVKDIAINCYFKSNIKITAYFGNGGSVKHYNTNIWLTNIPLEIKNAEVFYFEATQENEINIICFYKG